MDAKKDRTFEEIKKVVKELGSGVIGETAGDVDEKARFPSESFAALKENKLMSSYLPASYGGDELSFEQICEICLILGGYCGSTAMIYAMHQIQVACIYHHVADSDYFQRYLTRIHDEQLLLASATTEIGVGGDLRSSICHLERNGDNFKLEKKAPVISYALDADAILVTCRASEESPAGDQVHVVLDKGQYQLEPLTGWDTLGFRGTCSSGFTLTAEASLNQVLPVPFAQILSQTMHPVAHLTWGSLWTGLAQGAVNKARASVRNAIRQSGEIPPITATRLAELGEVMFSMSSGVKTTIAEYQKLLDTNSLSSTENYGFAVKVNNVKTSCSELVVDVVGKALLIVGIGGYRNDGRFSLCRELRDAYGASLMVNNDRIRGHNATMQVAIKDG